MTHPQPTTDLIDITAVAQRLGVQVRHVRRLVHERRIPLHKVGPPHPLRPRRHRGVTRERPVRRAGRRTGR
jgi:excisionase family DNA binding protein